MRHIGGANSSASTLSGQLGEAKPIIGAAPKHQRRRADYYQNTATAVVKSIFRD
jgi:hypothetical protein